MTNKLISKLNAAGMPEVVVAAAILAVAVYGTLNFSIRAIQQTDDIDQKNKAALLIEEMANRIQVNHYNANLGVNAAEGVSYYYRDVGNGETYDEYFNRVATEYGSDSGSQRGACYDDPLRISECDNFGWHNGTYRQTLSNIDLYEWMKKVSEDLPNGRGITCASDSGGLSTVITGTDDLGGCGNTMPSSSPHFLIKVSWDGRDGTRIMQHARVSIPQYPISKTLGFSVSGTPWGNEPQTASGLPVHNRVCEEGTRRIRCSVGMTYRYYSCNQGCSAVKGWCDDCCRCCIWYVAGEVCRDCPGLCRECASCSAPNGDRWSRTINFTYRMWVREQDVNDAVNRPWRYYDHVRNNGSTYTTETNHTSSGRVSRLQYTNGVDLYQKYLFRLGTHILSPNGLQYCWAWMSDSFALEWLKRRNSGHVLASGATLNFNDWISTLLFNDAQSWLNHIPGGTSVSGIDHPFDDVAGLINQPGLGHLANLFRAPQADHLTGFICAGATNVALAALGHVGVLSAISDGQDKELEVRHLGCVIEQDRSCQTMCSDLSTSCPVLSGSVY